MKKLNIIFSILLVVFSGIFFFYADTFKTLPGQTDIGPSAFPKAVCVVLAVVAVINAVSYIRKEEDEPINLFNWKWLVGVVVALLYFVLFKRLGFLLTSIVAIFVLEFLLLNEPFKKAWPLMTAVAILAPVAIQLIFGTFLKVPLPAGILSGILG